MKNLKFLLLPLIFITVSCYVYKPHGEAVEEETAANEKAFKTSQTVSLEQKQTAMRERTAVAPTDDERMRGRRDALAVSGNRSDEEKRKMDEEMKKREEVMEEEKKRMEEKMRTGQELSGDEKRRMDDLAKMDEKRRMEDQKIMEEEKRREEEMKKKMEEEAEAKKTAPGRVVQPPRRGGKKEAAPEPVVEGIKGKIKPNRIYKITAENKQYKIQANQWEEDTLVAHVLRKPDKVLKFHENQIEEETVMERRFSKSYSDLITIGAYAAGGLTVLLLLL